MYVLDKVGCGESVASVGRYCHVGLYVHMFWRPVLLTPCFLQDQSLTQHDLDTHSMIQEHNPHGKQVISII